MRWNEKKKNGERKNVTRGKGRWARVTVHNTTLLCCKGGTKKSKSLMKQNKYMSVGVCVFLGASVASALHLDWKIKCTNKKKKLTDHIQSPLQTQPHSNTRISLLCNHLNKWLAEIHKHHFLERQTAACGLNSICETKSYELARHRPYGAFKRCSWQKGKETQRTSSLQFKYSWCLKCDATIHYAQHWETNVHLYYVLVIKQKRWGEEEIPKKHLLLLRLQPKAPKSFWLLRGTENFHLKHKIAFKDTEGSFRGFGTETTKRKPPLHHGMRYL